MIFISAVYLQFTWPIDSRYCAQYGYDKRWLLTIQEQGRPSVDNKTRRYSGDIYAAKGVASGERSLLCGPSGGTGCHRQRFSTENGLAAAMLCNFLCLDPNTLLFFFLYIIQKNCHSSPKPWHDAPCCISWGFARWQCLQAANLPGQRWGMLQCTGRNLVL